MILFFFIRKKLMINKILYCWFITYLLLYYAEMIHPCEKVFFQLIVHIFNDSSYPLTLVSNILQLQNVP